MSGNAALLTRALKSAGDRKREKFLLEVAAFEQFEKDAEEACSRSLEEFLAFLKEFTSDAGKSTEQEKTSLRLARSAYTAANEESNSDSSLRALREQLAISVDDPFRTAFVSNAVTERFKEGLRRARRKLDHAIAFDRIAQEYLAYHGSAASAESETARKHTESESLPEMLEQREQFEKFVFSRSEVNEKEVELFVLGLFKSPEAKAFLSHVRKRMRAAGETIRNYPLDLTGLKKYITTLKNDDLFTSEKKIVLDELLQNETMLREMVGVLKIMWDDLPIWEWANPVPVTMRRQLNGKYRVYMDEDICEALLLHIMGVQWSIHFREIMCEVWDHDAWVLQSSTADARIAENFEPINFSKLRYRNSSDTVAGKRLKYYRDSFYLTLLPDDEDDAINGAYDEPSNSLVAASGTPAELKQLILRLFITEAEFNYYVHKSFTAIQTDFEWFGPSLPHKTILTVLRVLGVDDMWLTVFERFLKAPLFFAVDRQLGTDKQLNAPQVRQRTSGVPMNHALSTFMGESVLLMLDYAVNRATDGDVYLYRLHDDVWFWSASHDRCLDAWRALQGGVHTFGLRLNEAKTGSIRLLPDGEATPHSTINELPSRPIRWGFLLFDAKHRLTVDDALLDTHVLELTRQLRIIQKQGGGVLELVKAWNVYFSTFLTFNFGPITRGLGLDHINLIISKLVDIHKRVVNNLFNSETIVASSSSKSFVEYLMANLPSGVREKSNLSEIFFHWPVELGGMGLENPLRDLLFARTGLQAKIDEEKDLNQHFNDEAKEILADGVAPQETGKNLSSSANKWDLCNRFATLENTDRIHYRKDEKKYKEEVSAGEFLKFPDYTNALLREFRFPWWKDEYAQSIAAYDPEDAVMWKGPLYYDVCSALQAVQDERGDQSGDDTARVLHLAGSFAPEIRQEIGGFRFVDSRWASFEILMYLRKQKMLWAN